MSKEIRKTVEVNRGFEVTFEEYLISNNMKYEDCTLSNGHKIWDITIENESSIQEIKNLPYVSHFEDTIFYYPS